MSFRRYCAASMKRSSPRLRKWWCGARGRRSGVSACRRYGGGVPLCVAPRSSDLRAHTQPMQRHVNVGTGVDVTIRELAEQSPPWWAMKESSPLTLQSPMARRGSFWMCPAGASGLECSNFSFEGIAQTHEWFRKIARFCEVRRATKQLDNPPNLLRAATWMLLGIFALSAVAVAGREVSSNLDTFELMLYRSLLGVPVVWALARWRGKSLKPSVCLPFPS